MDAVKGVPEVLPLGQGGLLDIASASGFSEKPLDLPHLQCRSAASQQDCWPGVASMRTLTELTAVKTLFQVAQEKQGGQHFGSRLLWLDDGYPAHVHRRRRKSAIAA
jgi:glucose/arabinose dehydrogenase